MSTETPTTREFIDVDPRSIVLDENVRTIVDIDPDFYLSVKEHGVQQPVQVWRRDDGQLILERGQRRLLAAQQTERESITCEVIDRPGTDERELERGRIIRQLDENDHRSPLTPAEHVAATMALFELDMKPDEIAKATHRPRKVVREEVKLGRDHGRTVQAMAEQALPLDVAAELVEFEDDDALHATLAEQARTAPADFRVAVKRAQAARDEARKIDAVRGEVEARGDEFVSPQLHRESDNYEYLSHLMHPEVEATVKNRAQLTEDDARKLGGLVFTASKYWTSDGEAWRVLAIVRDPKVHGYIDRYGSSSSGPLTEDQKAERREKRERRKEWTAICEVRTEWIRDELLQRRTLPEDALEWVTRTMIWDRAACPDSWNPHTGKDRDLAAEWLALDVAAHNHRASLALAVEASKPGSADLRVALAVALARWEVTLTDPKHPWYADHREAGAYFKQIESWGYALSKHEKTLAKRKVRR